MNCDESHGAGMHGCGCCHGHDDGDEVPTSRIAGVMTSGGLTAVGLTLQWSGMGVAWTSRLAFLAAIAAGVWMFVPGAITALRRLSPDMNLLMVIAVVGAAGLGDWAEAATVVFLFSLSELLEALASRRSQRALRGLLDLAPDTALVREGDSLVERAADEVAIGARILVRSGERVPLDGQVLEGSSSVNQAPITGESVPVEKRAGDLVFAGSVNGEGSLEVRVTTPAGDTTLARIVRLIEEAQEQKAPAERFVDRFARVYTPLVFGAAVLGALGPPLVANAEWGTWFYRALVLLVIACPCALVISTPVAVVTALTALARHGVLVKGGAHLESLGRLRALAVDKTGTITEGRPRVLAVHAINSADESQVLAVAAAIEAHSQHPFAAAVLAAAEQQSIRVVRVSGYRAHGGRGAEGVCDGHRYFVGNHRFTHELGVCSPELEQTLNDIESTGRSVVVVGHAPHENCAGEVMGVIAIGDSMRPGAPAAVRALRGCGMERIVMLSGDNQRTTEAIAREAGVDEARGDLLPEQKVESVRALVARYGAAGMVGDGINDAPALAAATVGIAMGAAGSDTAIETADVALMRDDLSRLALAVRTGRRALGVIRFNISFALATKAVFLALAVAGYASLWLAILADTGATLLVIGNSLRLLRDSAHG
jgi:Zn2+/Cd2+-exporting ATPase